jgi:hypothetical protein
MGNEKVLAEDDRRWLWQVGRPNTDCAYVIKLLAESRQTSFSKLVSSNHRVSSTELAAAV